MGDTYSIKGRDPALQAEDFTKCVPSDEESLLETSHFSLNSMFGDNLPQRNFALEKELYKV
jgi:hypothetical protein